MYIKLPLYGTLLFYMAIGLNDFDGENPLLGPLEGVGPENRDILGATPFQWPSNNKDKSKY